MCDSPIETVKYIWVNIWCMLHWILSKKKCRNTFPLRTVDQLARSAKSLEAVVPNQLLAANADAVAYQMEEYKNSGLVVILHCLNSFQYNNYVKWSLLYVLLRENHRINAVSFPSSHNGCNTAFIV